MAQILMFPRNPAARHPAPHRDNRSWREACERYNVEINPYSFLDEEKYVHFCKKLANALASYGRKVSGYSLPGPCRGTENTHWRTTCDRYCVSISPYSFGSQTAYTAFCQQVDYVIQFLE